MAKRQNNQWMYDLLKEIEQTTMTGVTVDLLKYRDQIDSNYDGLAQNMGALDPSDVFRWWEPQVMKDIFKFRRYEYTGIDILEGKNEIEIADCEPDYLLFRAEIETKDEYGFSRYNVLRILSYFSILMALMDCCHAAVEYAKLNIWDNVLELTIQVQGHYHS